MSINKLRRVLYTTAKLLGDVQAVTHKDPAKAIPKRIMRRASGKLTGRLLGRLFPPTR